LRNHQHHKQKEAAMADDRADAIKNKVEGKVHEVKGAATGDTGEEMKGKMQGLKGDVQGEMARQREDVRDSEATRRTP
jgi:uncharacterized protein YjbJ (UPF0337 family)